MNNCFPRVPASGTSWTSTSGDWNRRISLPTNLLLFLTSFAVSFFLLTFAIKNMKYKVVFSAERRKCKKSGEIICNPDLLDEPTEQRVPSNVFEWPSRDGGRKANQPSGEFDRFRTCDHQSHNLVLYQLSYKLHITYSRWIRTTTSRTEIWYATNYTMEQCSRRLKDSNLWDVAVCQFSGLVQSTNSAKSPVVRLVRDSYSRPWHS